MAHNHMDHGGHLGHGDMDMPGESPMCSMNMLFTWSTKNLCIVFSSWRITSTVSLILSLLAVMALTAGYEAVREVARKYERTHAMKLENATRLADDERSSLLGVITGSTAQAEEQRGKVVKAALYGVQVFYSFFIMLLFMTYNGWIMLAVGFGAFVGYLLFGGSSIDKSAACH